MSMLVRFALRWLFRRLLWAVIIGGVFAQAAHAQLLPQWASTPLSAIQKLGSAPAPSMPSHELTPGAIITDDRATICTPGYATSVRPRGSEWRSLKATVRERYQNAGIATGTVGDHLVPLAIGGAPRDVRNIWLQPYEDAHAKDRVEMELWLLVCDGRMDVTAAQQRIALDWRTAVPANTDFTERERRWLARLEADVDY